MDMISASAADAHRFGRVKRNGYDPAEVDAVVSRLVETLRAYETKTERLEERLAEADASADAIRMTFIAAERTRDEILDGARLQAESIRDAARTEADDVVSGARTKADELEALALTEADQISARARELENEMSGERERILASAHEEAEKILTEAEGEAATRTAEAMANADGIVRAAVDHTEALRRETGQAAQAATTAAAWIRREAMSDASAIVGSAEERAALIIADAEQDGAMVHQRASMLRDAIASLEASARNLADVTATEVSVIDLSKIEAVEADKVLVFEPEPHHAMAELATTEIDDGATSAAPPVEPRRLLTVAEATAALEVEESDTESEHEPVAAEPTGPRTYYQRTTGVPLSERVRTARKSG